eukprot:PRCOL_00006801-RA
MATGELKLLQLATYKKKETMPKTAAAADFLRNALKKIVLFAGIDDDQTAEVVDACEQVSAKGGEVIIRQGDTVADYFYILEEGTAEASIEGKGVVKTYSGSGDSFGELALMYSAPRAATVKATSDCRMWRLDRSTFQLIVIASTRLKRDKYETFLRSVPLLQVLDWEEIAALADVLEPTKYDVGAVIIKEGDTGGQLASEARLRTRMGAYTFFIVEEGTVIATTASGESTSFEKASYFGELALLTSEPRKATCVAATQCKLITIDVTSFGRLLGKADEILCRNAEKYRIFLEKGAAAVFTAEA